MKLEFFIVFGTFICFVNCYNYKAHGEPLDPRYHFRYKRVVPSNKGDSGNNSSKYKKIVLEKVKRF